MNKQLIISILLIIVGIIHLLPLKGLFGAGHLEELYQVSVSGPDMEILMRHRAVLFGILGGFLCFAAFKQPLQPAAFVMGYISVLAFLVLAWTTPGYNQAIGRVVIADYIALGCLFGANILFALKS